MRHTRGKPYHPQNQGKIERWHRSLKNRILLDNHYLPGELEEEIRKFVTPRPNELLCNATRVVGRDGRDLYSADTEDLTEAEFAERGDNLLIAGRCLSAEHEALASARVTAQCFGYGHAAGVAITEAQRSARRPADITGEEVRALMNADGA